MRVWKLPVYLWCNSFNIAASFVTAGLPQACCNTVLFISHSTSAILQLNYDRTAHQRSFALTRIAMFDIGVVVLAALFFWGSQPVADDHHQAAHDVEMAEMNPLFDDEGSSDSSEHERQQVDQMLRNEQSAMNLCATEGGSVSPSTTHSSIEEIGTDEHVAILCV